MLSYLRLEMRCVLVGEIRDGHTLLTCSARPSCGDGVSATLYMVDKSEAKRYLCGGYSFARWWGSRS